MKGLESMLASMLGVTPEMMQNTIAGISEAATKGVAAIERVEKRLNDIDAKLEALNVRMDNANRNGTS